VRARGFTLPLAGKTGTFARRLGLRASPTIWSASSGSALTIITISAVAGGATAAPIWADFMIRATAMPAYRDVKDLTSPKAWIRGHRCGHPAIGHAELPGDAREVYVTGSAPTQLCELHGGHGARLGGGIFPLAYVWRRLIEISAIARAIQTPPRSSRIRKPRRKTGRHPPRHQGQREEKSPLQKIFGIFGIRRRRARQT